MERRVKIDKGPRRPGVSPNIYIYISWKREGD